MNKRTVINNLPLKLFIFIGFYQFLIYINSQQNLVNNGSTISDTTMSYMSEQYWSQYMCQNNQSYFIQLNDSLYEMKGVSFKASTSEQTPADKLNNIEQRGMLFTSVLTYRSYDSNESKWSQWFDNTTLLSIRPTVSMKKINGAWQVENVRIFKLPNCSNLPQ